MWGTGGWGALLFFYIRGLEVVLSLNTPPFLLFLVPIENSARRGKMKGEDKWRFLNRSAFCARDQKGKQIPHTPTNALI